MSGLSPSARVELAAGLDLPICSLSWWVMRYVLAVLLLVTPADAGGR